jgi:hypothetical protein
MGVGYRRRSGNKFFYRKMLLLFILFLLFLFSLYLYETVPGLRLIVSLYLVFESRVISIMTILTRLVGQLVAFILEKIKLILYFFLRKIFSYFYDVGLFEKIRIIFRIVWVLSWPFIWRTPLTLLFLHAALLYIGLIVSILCLGLFLLPWEKIGYYMIDHPAVSLGRLKEIGIISEKKIAAPFNAPLDSWTFPGIEIWQEHAVLCFIGYSLSILVVFAFLVSWGVTSQSTMQRVADFLNHDVHPEYMSFVHANYIGRYMHFVHDYFFILIDPKFVIPTNRADLEIYYRGDFIYYFLVNLEDPYVQQFIPLFCFWIFCVSILLSLPYNLGFFGYFLFLRILHVLVFSLLKQFLLPAFSMRAIRKDFREINIELATLGKEWKTYPPFFGEGYVFITVTCFFSIVFAVIFL